MADLAMFICGVTGVFCIGVLVGRWSERAQKKAHSERMWRAAMSKKFAPLRIVDGGPRSRPRTAPPGGGSAA